MKKWSGIVAGLYGLLLLALTWPAFKIVFFHYKSKVEIGQMFASWPYWAWIAVFVLSQFAFLTVPVEVASKRPVTKKSLVFQVIASSLMMGGLVAGAAVSIGEIVKSNIVPMWVFWGTLGGAWVFWAVVFLRWRLKLEPKVFLEKQCRLLFKGSILELLVAVPTHILARGKEYCCAGFDTALGIACGLAVMLFSFGPGIFFLYADRWAKLHPPKQPGKTAENQP